MLKTVKEKKCRECGNKFKPSMTTQTSCSPICAIAQGKKKVARDKQELKKVELKQSRARVESVQPLSYYHKKAQAAFNAFIRERDAGQPCISCGKPDDGSHQRHASHYKSVGSSRELRYDEMNVHAACSVCNNHLSGNIQGYTPALIEKVGINEFDRLNGPQKSKKWSREELNEITSKYRKKAKEIRR
jgi:5-methylcytosine-specific restriction endonuclease McrA